MPLRNTGPRGGMSFRNEGTPQGICTHPNLLSYKEKRRDPGRGIPTWLCDTMHTIFHGEEDSHVVQ